MLIEQLIASCTNKNWRSSLWRLHWNRSENVISNISKRKTAESFMFHLEWINVRFHLKPSSCWGEKLRILYPCSAFHQLDNKLLHIAFCVSMHQKLGMAHCKYTGMWKMKTNAMAGNELDPVSNIIWMFYSGFAWSGWVKLGTISTVWVGQLIFSIQPTLCPSRWHVAGNMNKPQ